MIISCEQCRAQFRLDDSKVPEGGARVRCSKCNHAFYIAPPGHADELEAENLAREALESRQPPEADDSESDWQFNEDASPATPEATPGLKAAQDAVDDLLGDLTRAAMVDPAPEASLSPEPDPEPGLGPEPELDSEAELFERPEPEPAPPASAAAPGAEAGSPEGWNFFEEAEEPDPPETDDDPAGTLGRLALMPRWKLLEQEREAAERAIEARAAAADLEDASPTLRRWLGRVASGVGWAATLGLLASGGSSVLTRSAPEPTAAPPVLEVAGLRAEGLQARWVENAQSGPLLVVSGRLRPSGGSVHTGPLAFRLLDAGGEPVASATTPVGPPFPEGALREGDPAELQAAQGRAAADFARLHSGESAPFQALFAEVPADAAGLALEHATGPRAR